MVDYRYIELYRIDDDDIIIMNYTNYWVISYRSGNNVDLRTDVYHSSSISLSLPLSLTHTHLQTIYVQNRLEIRTSPVWIIRCISRLHMLFICSVHQIHLFCFNVPYIVKTFIYTFKITYFLYKHFMIHWNWCFSLSLNLKCFAFPYFPVFTIFSL